ncbi:hypothetical protein IT157_03845 [bacterium]|nr:hypothetical protein [bacterium]
MMRITTTGDKRGRNYFRPLFAFLLMIIIAGCTLPQQPGELWWDVDLQVPLGVRTYGMWELAQADSVLEDEGSGVGMTEDSSLYFAAWSHLSAELGDSLYFSPIALAVIRNLRAIEAPLFHDTLISYSLGGLNSEFAALHGTVQDVPRHSLIGAVSLSLPFGYDSMEVDTGDVQAFVQNRLPYDVTNVQVAIGGVTVWAVDTLRSETSLQVTGTLDDARLASSFDVRFSATGEGGSAILIDSTDQITFSILADTVTASRFYGMVPEQTVEEDSSLAMNQAHRIDLAIIESGAMHLTLGNLTQFDDTVTVHLPELVSRLNDTLTVTRFLSAGDSETVTIDLEEYRLRPSATGNQTLRGELSSHTPSPPERREFEGDGEYVFARFEIERLQFNYFDGYLNELRLPMARTEIEVEQPPAGWERVHPLDVEARVHITDGFGGTLSAEIHAETRLNGAPVGARDLLIDDVALTDTTVIITGLAELMQDYPDTLSAEGEAVLSGDVAVYSNVEVNLAVELRAGFSLTLEGEIEPEGTVEKIDSRELDDVQSGTATVKLWNHLPAGGRCFLVASRDSLTVLNSSGADADTLFDVHVPSAPTEAGRAT